MVTAVNLPLRLVAAFGGFVFLAASARVSAGGR
jgi:hypothetical protein